MPDRRVSSPHDQRQSAAVGGASSPHRDPGPGGSALLVRARQLCEADGTAAGGWAVVGAPPSVHEVVTQLSREFGRAAVARYEKDVREMVEASADARNPLAAAERDRVRRIRAVVRMAPWVGVTMALREPDPPRLSLSGGVALGGPDTSRISPAAAAADALGGYDFGAVQRLLDEERAEASRFEDILAARAAEVC